MPKRTNTFQAVVFMIKKHIGDDAVVTESAELRDIVSGEKREVDVCIEANIAGHTVLICLECRDHKRAQAVGWVEEMYTKHSRLPTDRLVLVSNSGFTKGALAKARSFGIETVVPEYITEERASEIANWVSMVYTRLYLRAEMVYAWVAATESEEAEVVLALPHNSVFTESRDLIVPMVEIVQKMMQEAQAKLGELIFVASEDTKAFTVTAEPAEITTGSPPAPHCLYMEKVDSNPHLRRLDKIVIHGNAKIMRSDFALNSGQLQGTVYSWGETILEGKPAVIVSTEGADDKITMTIRTL